MGQASTNTEYRVNSSPDTCHINNHTNCTISSNSLTLPTYGQSNFWLVLTQYNLNALELISKFTPWSIRYSELKDISSVSDDLSHSDELDYELITSGLFTLKSHSIGAMNKLGDAKWKFIASAPILDAYQIVQGTHLVKLKINEKLSENPKKVKLCSFQKTIFGTYVWDEEETSFFERTDSSTWIAEEPKYDEVTMPLINTELDVAKESFISMSIGNKNAKKKEIIPEVDETLTGNSQILIVSVIMIILIGISIICKRKCRKKHKRTHTRSSPHKKNRILKSTSLNEHIVGQLKIFTNKVLGYGSMGTIVYKGIFANRSVAVKRLLRAFNTIASKEVSTLITSDNHPNVIQYYAKEEDSEFIYIALEKCAGSLDKLIESGMDKAKTSRLLKLFSAGEINTNLVLRLFKESLEGLSFLHANKIVHRDLKPQNILISKLKKAKISDMGLCKQLTNIERSFETNATGTWGWQPAEVLSKKKQHSSIDIFSMGCILYYSLSEGKHPFGDKFSRESNILQGKFDLSELSKDNYIAAHLIWHMISLDPTKRPTTEDCLNHILFWDYERRLSFLCEISNKLEYDYGVNQHNGKLVIGFDKIAKELGIFDHCNGKWNKLIDDFIMDELTNHRKKYNYSSSIDLIRVNNK